MLRVELGDLPEITDLARVWKDLERRAQSSFFLSWFWISTWLDSYNPNAKLLSVHDAANRIVGIGIFSIADRKRLGIMSREVLYLHQTGNPEEDHIWIEYNGILTEKGRSSQVYQAIGEYFSKSERTEIALAAIRKTDLFKFELTDDLKYHTYWSTWTHGVDLKRLRQEEKTYLSSLSRNTRYQINRSIRVYETDSEIKLRRAENLAEALSFFEEIRPLHLERWGSDLGESGFANPRFVDFHMRLITNGADQGRVELLRIECGPRKIGYLYNFLHNNTVYFYLSGFSGLEHRFEKPGLVSHAISIQHYLERGFLYYDFMGGYERYKASLGNASDELVSVSIQRQDPIRKLETLLRKLKNLSARA